jgi:hypothetical protein
VYTGVNTYDQYDAYNHQIWPHKPCASLPQKMLPNRLLISKTGFLSAISNIKYREYVLLIFWPNWHFQPRNIWDHDINYPALISIFVHAYLLLTCSSIRALFSPPGINLVTHLTQESRYNLDGAYTQDSTRNHCRAAARAARAPFSSI